MAAAALGMPPVELSMCASMCVFARVCCCALVSCGCGCLHVNKLRWKATRVEVVVCLLPRVLAVSVSVSASLSFSLPSSCCCCIFHGISHATLKRTTTSCRQLQSGDFVSPSSGCVPCEFLNWRKRIALSLSSFLSLSLFLFFALSLALFL